MKSIKDQSVQNKKVLLRVDFNVPVLRGEVADDSRIKISLPTIKYLLKSGARLILISHLGRPEGKIVFDLKLDGVARELKELLGLKNEVFADKINGFLGYHISSKIFLLENIRFYKEEEENNLEFAKKLASLADSPRGEAGIYVNDAFSASHRNHASTEAITHFLPSFAGLALEKEVEALSKLVKNPQKPFVCVLGGAKVSDKIDIIESLANKVDWFLLGGAMASTFLVSQGIELKDSLVAKDKIDVARKIWKHYGKKIILPSMLIFGKLNNKNAVLDIDEREIKKLFNKYLQGAKTIFWNGALGQTEDPKYRKGSRALAKQMLDSKAFTIVAGGDTIAFLNKLNLLKYFSYVSYGGGASLEFLAGKKFKSLKGLK